MVLPYSGVISAILLKLINSPVDNHNIPRYLQHNQSYFCQSVSSFPFLWASFSFCKVFAIVHPLTPPPHVRIQEANWLTSPKLLSDNSGRTTSSASASLGWLDRSLLVKPLFNKEGLTESDGCFLKLDFCDSSPPLLLKEQELCPVNKPVLLRLLGKEYLLFAAIDVAGESPQEVVW